MATFTMTTSTSAMGAGVPTQAITLAITGTTVGTTTFTLTDGGAGGSFWPTAPTIAAGTNGSTQFVYVPALAASGTITLQAVASGGLVQTVTLALPIGLASVVVSDDFTGVAGTNLLGRAPTAAAATQVWTGYYQATSVVMDVNGVNNVAGLYRSGTTGSSFAVPVNANAAGCDSTISCTNINTTKTYPAVAMGIQNSVHLYGYLLVWGSASGWNFTKYVNNAATAFWTDTVLQQPTSGSTKQITISIRIINSTQYVFAIVNGVILHGGVPTADSTFTGLNSFGGLIEQVPAGQTPASTDSVYQGYRFLNVDWGTPANSTIFPNASITQSPYTWRNPGDGTLWAPGPGGPYLKFSVTGTTRILASVDTTINSAMTYATDMPFFTITIDDGVYQTVQIPMGAIQVNLTPTGITTGTHTVKVWAVTGAQGNGWTSTVPMVHLTNLQFDSGYSLSAYPFIYSKNALIFGDSFLEGYNGQPYTSGATVWPTVCIPPITWANFLSYGIPCEVGVVGVGGQGYLHSGSNSYPNLQTSWTNYDSTHVRSLSPAPDYFIVYSGQNDHRASYTAAQVQAAVQAFLVAVRADLPSTKIFVYLPVGGQAADEDGSGGANAAPIRAAVTAVGDSNTYLIDAGAELVQANNWVTPTWFSNGLSTGDGIHPGTTGHGVLGVLAAAEVAQTTVAPTIHATASC